MVTWYKHDIPKWMNGTETLDDGAYRAYHVICQLIYLHEGPITLNEHGIAGRCRQSVRAFRNNLQTLISSGKILLENGRLHNSRAVSELEKIGNSRENSSKGGIARAKALKNNNVRLVTAENNYAEKTRLEKTRKEKGKTLPVGADAHPRQTEDFDFGIPENTPSKSAVSSQGNGGSVATLEKQFYDRCREVFGDRHGGALGAKLLKSKNGNVALARSTVESASQKSEPRAYVGAVLRNERPANDPSYGDDRF